ncbi:IclR family transcriptional regulator [Paenibacillus allorhizosphaerae]|uniref:HTH-type transcriptional regulator XynR n=1 Tax=Paenibacillus allorhizosphaerae TaxID=2849866 RepID=A0ABN7U270_9BACL|nr:IclR family transcriptional regulator [Paenibacillus allorhizosphaerae]CAG7659083.1 HTH-type transcriptional regulator XynR [Paenibacillus allorhizosphaerae]
MKETEKQAATATVKSANRVLDIFELFADCHESLNLSKISRQLDLPASSTHKLLQNLLARGYLETDKQGKTFRLGYKLFEIGSKYAGRTDLAEEFQYVAQKMVDDLNESVFLTIRNGEMALYVAEKQSTHPVRFVSHLGMQLPLHATAMGKVLLSGMTDGEIQTLYPDKQLGRLTETTVTDFGELMEQLERIRVEGVEYSRGESVHGVRCAAAPIYGAPHKITASLGVSTPEARWDPKLWERIVQAVKTGAKEISMKLFYAR